MKTKLLIGIVGIAAAAAALGTRSWMGDHREAGLAASGMLEARNINVGSKIAGRVTRVLVREGDQVEPGQLLVTFDDAELAAQLKQAEGHLAQAQANLQKLERGSRAEEIASARAASATSQDAVAQAEAELKQAQAQSANAEQHFRRMDSLFAKGGVSRQNRDDAETSFVSAQAQVKALESAVSAAKARLRASSAQQELVERGPRAEDIAAARAEVAQAQGELALAKARWAEREVRSPAAASVEVLDLRPGDLLPANAPVAKLLETDELYVVVYVPESQVGRVQVGQRAQLRVDAFPDQSFPATVEQIRQQAEFLPRNVQTAEERQHQVFGVKLRVDNPSRKLRAGVQADVRFVEAK